MTETIVWADGYQMTLKGRPKTTAAADLADLAERQEGNVRVAAPTIKEGALEATESALFPPAAVAEMIRVAAVVRTEFL